MAKVLYTIGEAAEILGENVSAVRYWSNCFEKFLNPARNGKGNRLYHPEDIETLREIHHLLRVEGLTLEGVSMRLRDDRRSVETRVKVLDSLKEIRKELQEVRKSL